MSENLYTPGLIRPNSNTNLLQQHCNLETLPSEGFQQQSSYGYYPCEDAQKMAPLEEQPITPENGRNSKSEVCSTIEKNSSQVKPCIVVLRRSLEVEAALKREQRGKLAKFSTQKQEDLMEKKLQPSKKKSHHEVSFTCNQCGQGFTGRTTFVQHFRSCSPAPPGSCPLCPKILSSPHKLRDHLRFVHGKTEQEIILPCSLCDKKCKSRSSLEKHIILRHSSVSPSAPFLCDLCKQEFSSKIQLKLHLSEKHMTNEYESSLATETCEIKSDEVNDMVQKMIVSSGPPVKVYSCPHCHTLHANKDRFKKHLGFILPPSFIAYQVNVDPHVLAKQKLPVKCKVCGSKAANLAFLYTHQASHSQLQRPHKCKHFKCGRRFLFRCQLDRHTLLHQVGATQKEPKVSGGDPALNLIRYKCSLCKRLVKSQERLQAHNRSCHRDNIDFRCKVCDICYQSAKSLNRHCNKKQHKHVQQVSEPWLEPETPVIQFSGNTNSITPTVRPDSLGSSDSVSTSDAFSMYFQSLHSLSSLDQALGFEDNSLFDNDLSKNMYFPSESCVTSQMLQGRPAVTEVTELNGQDQEFGQELQFHTLQTVPMEPLTDLDSTYMQNVKVEPLTKVQHISSYTPKQIITNVSQIFVAKIDSIQTDNECSNAASIKAEDTYQPEIVKSDNSMASLESLLAMPIQNLEMGQYSVDMNVAGDDKPDSKEELQQLLSQELENPADGQPEVKDEVCQDENSKVETSDSVNIEELKLQKIDSILQDMSHTLDINSSTSTSFIKSESNSESVSINDSFCEPKITNKVVPTEIVSKNKVKPSGSCLDCGKLFSSAQSASRHAKRSCPGRNNASETYCSQCDLKFNNRSELHKHKRDVHPDTLFSCSACGRVFLLATSLGRHQKENCTYRDSFACRQCKKNFPSPDELRLHSAAEHQDSTVCNVCGKTLSTSQSLKRHMRSHKQSGEISQISADEESLSLPALPLLQSPLIASSQTSPQLGTQSTTHDDTTTNKKRKKSSDQSGADKKKKGRNDSTENSSITLYGGSSFEEGGEILSQGCTVKTQSISSNDQLVVEDILSDFSSLSNNPLYNGSNGESLPEEFNISDMFLIKNGALQCDFCEASFSSDNLLLRHLSEQHFPNTQWQPAQNAGQSGNSSSASNVSH